MGSYRIPVNPRVHPVVADLVRARQQRRMSQDALALRLGTSQTCVSYWESGKRAVTLDDLTRWAAVFGLDIHVGTPTPADGPHPELVAGGLA